MSHQLDVSRVLAASCAAYAYSIRRPSIGGPSSAPQRPDRASKSPISTTHHSPGPARRLP
jgi:hypothetical protein